MELSNKIKKFNNININDIEQFENVDFIDDIVTSIQKDTEDMYYKFLTENGYKIDKPYNIEQLKEIKEELAKQDKFVDHLEYTQCNDNWTQVYHYVLLFFNSISNPLTAEVRNELIEKWKEKNRKDK